MVGGLIEEGPRPPDELSSFMSNNPIQPRVGPLRRPKTSRPSR